MREFDLLTVYDLIDDIVFVGCRFNLNATISGEFFLRFGQTNPASTTMRVRFVRCEFAKNMVGDVTNRPDLVAFDGCIFEENSFIAVL
jgi:hypothetical protein